MSTINTAAELQAFFDEHLSHLPASAKAELNILLLKDIKKDLKSGTKKSRAPKIDEEGNIIKQTLHEGMLTWRKFYKEINSKLLALTGQEKLPSMNIVRFSSVLKEAGHYYNEAGELDLDDSFILQEYNKWLALPEELKFPNKKSSAKSSKKASAVQSNATTDVEQSDVEEEKPKAKPRAKKTEKVEETKPVVEEKPEPVKKAPAKKETKSKAESKVESEAETEKPKKVINKKSK